MLPRTLHIALLLAMGILLAGCADDKAPIPTDFPTGWEGTAERWWRTDVDTTGTFRNLETLADMGIPGSNLLAVETTGIVEADGELARITLIQLVKQSLIELIRHRPETVDSLFNKFVIPKIGNVDAERDIASGTDLTPLVKNYQKLGYQILARHFRRPVTVLKLVEDIPVPVPDSLRGSGRGGTVMMQVAINKEGIPTAIEKLESAHPVLDAIAMRATTQMRWQPAYLLTGGRSVPVASWARFKVRFDLSR